MDEVDKSIIATIYQSQMDLLRGVEKRTEAALLETRRNVDSATNLYRETQTQLNETREKIAELGLLAKRDQVELL